LISEDAQRVADLHQNSGLNCSQAMLSVYGKKFDLPEQTAIKVASAFGAGMGGMGNVCGAVTGAFLVLGLTYEIGNPTARQDIYHLVQEVARRFTARHGSISCNELLGFDISTAEGLKTIREKKLTSTICPLLDSSAAAILEELLAEKARQK
jgi:C_GCAxxG_C_C family probable redox protein